MPNRTQIDRLVQQGVFTAQDVQGLDDAALFDELLRMMPPAAPAQPAPAAPVVPAVVTPTQPAAPVAPVRSDLAAAALALEANGLLERRGDFYVAKQPEVAAIADSLNKQIQDRNQVLTEITDPAAWSKKYLEPAMDPRFKAMEEQLAQLKSQLEAATPKPHDQWIAQNRDKLYTTQPNGQQSLSPAGEAYDQTWRQLESLGVADPKVLHTSASQAAMAAMKAYQPAPAPIQSPQTFMQGAANYQPQPGFNLPGTPLSQQNPQPPVLMNSRGLPDFDAIVRGVQNGSIPRQ